MKLFTFGLILVAPKSSREDPAAQHNEHVRSPINRYISHFEMLEFPREFSLHQMLQLVVLPYTRKHNLKETSLFVHSRLPFLPTWKIMVDMLPKISFLKISYHPPSSRFVNTIKSPFLKLSSSLFEPLKENSACTIVFSIFTRVEKEKNWAYKLDEEMFIIIGTPNFKNIISRMLQKENFHKEEENFVSFFNLFFDFNDILLK